MAAPEDGFELTPSIKAAAEVATRAATTDRAALVSALERVLATIPTRGRAPFSPGEAVLLEQSLKLSTSDLDALLVGATDAFRGAAAAGVNAQGLAERVTAAGGTETAASCFRDAWRAGSAAALNALRSAEWGSADVLRGVNWRVSVPLASDAAAGGQEKATPPAPVARFELTVGRAGHTAVGAPGTRRIAFECTQEQLGQLFDDCERIQAQLDALGQQ